jgi:cell wall-associated NlpC family hydrolase
MKHPAQTKSARWRSPLAVLLSIATLLVANPAPALAADVTTPGGFSALASSRLLDTRTGLGLATGTPSALAAGATLSLQVAGRGGVPATGAGSVVLNVTVTAPTAAGHITVYADGTARPATTNVSFAAAQTVPNLVVSRVGTDGMVSLANVSEGTVQLIADVSGYYRSGPATAAGTFTSVTPVNVLDTAAGVGAPMATVSAGAEVNLLVAGVGGVPATGAGAVTLNVTATAPTSAGSVTVYPAGASRPVASNLNFTPNHTSTNMVVVRVGVGGRVLLVNGSAGTLTLSADVAGYFAAGAPAVSGAFGTLAPTRLLDTRTTAPVANPKVAVVVAAARAILGVPYSYGGGNTAGPSRGIAQGANTVGFDCSASVQYEYAKAGVNLARITTGQEKQGTAVPRSGTLGLGSALSGDLLFWGTPGATYHVALYIGSGQMIEAQKTGTFVHVIAVWGSPSVIRRILPATVATSVAPGATVRLQVSGRGGMPASGASAVALNVTAVAPTAAGYVMVYGSSTTRPTASNLNFVRGQTIPNLVFTQVGADGTVLLYNGSTGTVHLLVDVSGYYRL